MKQIDILKYLLCVEFLQPFKLPSLKKCAHTKIAPASEVQSAALELLAEQFRSVKNEKYPDKLKVFIKIYGGVFSTKKINEILQKRWGESPEISESDYDCAAFVLQFSGDLNYLDEQKNLINFKSVQAKQCYEIAISENFALEEIKLSSACWALKNIGQIDKLNAGEFFNFSNEFSEQFEAKSDKNLFEFYQEFCEKFCSEFGDFVNEVKFKTRIEAKIAKSSDGEIFLNSFYLNDLAQILRDYQSGQRHELIDKYLSERAHPKRVDVVKMSKKSALKQYAQSLTPAAFASPYALYYSQQFAVNEIIKRFKTQGGFYAINGPPGTGKTTLIKDVIAAIITERAMVLSELNANEIMHKKGEIYELNDALKGYEMLIASSNNGAVENLSLEIPKISSVDQKFLEKVDYFKEISTRLLSENYKKDTAAWGLICAAFGKKANQNSLVFNAFYNCAAPKDCSNIDENFITLDKNGGRIVRGLRDYIKSTRADFEAAKSEFKQALKNVKTLQHAQIDNLEEFENLNKSLASLKEKIAQKEKFQSSIKALNAEIEQNQNALESTAAKREEIAAEIAAIEEKKSRINIPAQPGFLHWLFKTAAYKNYAALSEICLKDLQKLSAQIENLETSFAQIDEKFKAHKNENSRLSKALSSAQNELEQIAKCEQELGRIDKKLKSEFKQIEEIFTACESDKIELCAPFLRGENGLNDLAHARINLFAAALNLHKAAILANAQSFDQNLEKFAKYLKSELKENLKPDDILSLLQSVFFIIPALSSTFASIQTCFRDIPKNSLGFLLCDESAQAAIGAPLGALYRAKAAIVVGDPLQLEPVCPLAISVNRRLMDQFGVDDAFNIHLASLQTRADFVEQFGTYVGSGADKKWLGSPLRVHSRCDEPMFSIANRIAYDGLMISSRAKNALDSYWIDVCEGEFNGNCNRLEIAALERLLRDELADMHAKSAIISPFRDCVLQINALLNQDEFGEIDRGKVGTIHTMQGKEADVVVLVLGGSSAGARAWTASKPNLLNVALTRAKKRIYIIANRAEYLRLPYFAECASLPVKAAGVAE